MKDFTKTEFDIIIQGGQSNAEGTGNGRVKAHYEPDDRVWYLCRNGTISRAEERVVHNHCRGDFSLSFARRYIQDGRLEQGRELLIIRAAVGGTGFSDKRWGLCGDLFLQMMKMTEAALALNPKNKVTAFLWHQGEHDAVLGASSDLHYQNLISLKNTVRETLKLPFLPFIAADFVQSWISENTEACEPVRRAMRRVCDEKYAAFIETDGLKSNFEEYGLEPDFRDSSGQPARDTIHFSRAALYELGERYYKAYTGILEDK